jgi:hypothetical protein
VYQGTAGSCYGEADTSKRPYRLDWEARGASFFEDFHFATKTKTHGSSKYLSHHRAKKNGVIEAHGDHAGIREGQRTDGLRRERGHMSTRRSWKHFLAAMRFNHVPYGPGIWPAFWSNGLGRWPDSGEVDILEYANDHRNKVSLHTGSVNRCKLDPREVNKCRRMPDANNMSYNCQTLYRPEDPLLGCGPNHASGHRTGRSWSKTPGVVAVEWVNEFVKVFFFPEQEIPADLSIGKPQPNTWDKYIISFFPFASSEARSPGSCPKDPLQPQKLLLNIELCGDWAGHTFRAYKGMPKQQEWQDKIALGQCIRSHYAGSDDCCTNYVAQPELDDYFKATAFFNISWVKVFVQDNTIHVK